jgi:PAS domain S-box-containing protein
MPSALLSPSPRTAAAALAGLFGLASATYIFFSDRLLAAVAPDAEKLTSLQTYKGLAYVGAATILVYALVRAGARHATRSRTADAALHTSEERLALALAGTSTGVWEWDARSNAVQASPEARAILGAGDEATLDAFMRAVHPDDYPRLHAAGARALAERTEYAAELRLARPGQPHRWIAIRGRGRYDAADQPAGLIGTVQDVHARKETELALEAHKDRLEELVAARTAALASAEEQTRGILASIADGVVGLDEQGRITFANLAACRILGQPEAALEGRHAHEALHPVQPDDGPCAPGACALRSALAAPGSARSDQEVFLRADGGAVPVEYALQPMARGGVLTFMDITERRAGEAARAAALFEAERLARVHREFLANMSHELRTPLNAVLGLAQVGARDEGAGEARARFTHIWESGQALLAVVNDILDFSKIEAGKLHIVRASFRVGDVVDRALDLVAASAHEKGLDLRVEEDAGLPDHAVGDELRLAQVLVNLLGNAVKFTARGSVTLTVRHADGQLVLGVSDTGAGMAPEVVARLFQPFEQADGSTTRSHGGTGLGLSICRRLLDLMGGDIHVESRPGAGSTFTARVPLASPSPPVTGGGDVALAGFAPAEGAALVAALGARGVAAHTAEEASALEAPVTLLLVAAEALGDAGLRAAVEAALARGQRVAMAAWPGAEGVPAPLRRRVRQVTRPLRARHVLTAMERPLDSVRAPPGRRRRLAGLSLLAAEDNEPNRLVLQAIVEGEGGRIDCAESGLRALELLGRAAPGDYQLLLTDIQMPGLDGYETTRRAHQLQPALPVVGLTAHAMPEERARCLAAGMVERLTKPVDLDALVSTILQHASPAPPRPTTLVDWAALAERLEGVPGLVAKLTATALRSQRETPAKLRDAAAAGDLAALAFMAHNVKGMSGNLSAPRVMELSQRAERAAREAAPEAPALGRELAEHVEALLAELAERQSR